MLINYPMMLMISYPTKRLKDYTEKKTNLLENVNKIHLLFCKPYEIELSNVRLLVSELARMFF